MANTYTQLMYHIIFSTKNRIPALNADHRSELFKYIWGIHKNHRSGGVEDHIHILTHMPTTLCVADYVRELKTGASKWIKEQSIFPYFEGWQDGYGAFTESFRHRDVLIDYIKGQEKHHRQESYLDEYRRLLHEAGIIFEEKYLT
jgi:REP element-mobilizing transposase RayT